MDVGTVGIKYQCKQHKIRNEKTQRGIKQVLILQTIAQFCVNKHEENGERRYAEQLNESNRFRSSIGNYERILYVFQTIVIE